MNVTQFAMRISCCSLLPTLLLLAVTMPGLAQTSRFRLLTGDGERTWVSEHVEASLESLAKSQRRVTFRTNGTMTMSEGDVPIEARWDLEDDASAIIVTERRSGEWLLTDTLWMEIIELNGKAMTLDYSNSSGHLRVQYRVEGDAGGQDTAGFAAFLAEFRAAMARHDRRKIADMTAFPFLSHDLPGFIRKPRHEPQFTRAEFIRYFDKLFDKTARRLIAVSTPTPMSGDDDEVRAFAIGIRRFKTGVIWVEFTRGDDGAWRLVRTDNVSE